MRRRGENAVIQLCRGMVDAGTMRASEREIAAVAQNVVITMEDCGTTQGITKGTIYRGEKVEVRLADSIRGRVSRANIVNPITDEVIVRENEMITAEAARKIEDLTSGFRLAGQPCNSTHSRSTNGRSSISRCTGSALTMDGCSTRWPGPARFTRMNPWSTSATTRLTRSHAGLVFGFHRRPNGRSRPQMQTSSAETTLTI